MVSFASSADMTCEPMLILSPSTEAPESSDATATFMREVASGP